ncbi:PREDICTED: putative BTB/POZ domain-containing protein At5g13600 [Tarenaya hassleriana]|uniref:putative BTB/POZ domain-containing protein At5g13600 n=1 Tax=Tarenaya hassleriana TaxID=28532 RepID=UPI00053C348A|nr:PREDICTED: putative BTB/POZ domain-containing protein At5g13600 [Tarenaya hassleriana]XP_010558763.1 PREDICTED: putative BTB/POZ domain-containing protein At5g13600 [Tarenaya hassleriana]
MACMKLGSKSEVFHLDGRTWLCSTGLQTDVVIQVEETTFHLHKFPLLSRSGFLENLLAEYDNDRVLQLDDIPGGARAFLLVAKFCYGVRIEVTASNVVSLRCAAEYLRMSEDYGEGNLVSQTENFLDEIFASWNGSIKALESCEEVLSAAEECSIVSRCIASLAMKACADPVLFGWPMSGGSEGTVFWNGIRTTAKPPSVNEDWWFDDVSFLKFRFYKRFIEEVESRGMKPEKVTGSIMHYTKRNLPLLGSNRQSCSENGTFTDTYSTLASSPVHEDQRTLLEEIVEILPSEKSVTPTKFLLRLLRTSMVLHTNPACQENLERKIGAQLDQAALEDLLLPNMGYSAETLYDVDRVQRILDHFMLADHDTSDLSNYIVEESQLLGGSHPLTPVTMVANLIDCYLAEVASDVNLKVSKFQELGAIIPEYARPLDDGIYRAIDIYLKAHPWMTDSEREQLCRLMNCQKLSLEACTHAAQNERLPLRVIVQVLFFEQLRLRTSVAGWIFVSDNINDVNPSGNLGLARANVVGVNEMRERVYELEKECLNMKQDLEKIVKTKGGWNIFCKRFGFRSKTRTSPCDKGGAALIHGETRG